MTDLDDRGADKRNNNDADDDEESDDKVKDKDDDLSNIDISVDDMSFVVGDGSSIGARIVDVQSSLTVDAESSLVRADIEHASEFLALHGELATCESAVQSCRDSMRDYSSHLALNSSALLELLQRASSIRQSLANRHAAQRALSKCVELIVLPPELVENICQAAVDGEKFCDSVTQFDAFLESLDLYSTQWPEACRDVERISLLLLHKAASRIRLFLLERLETMTRPNADVSALQRSLVERSALFTFLRRRVAGARSIDGSMAARAMGARTAAAPAATDLRRPMPDVAGEIESIYCDVMSKIYRYYFFTYRCDLAKLQAIDSVARATDMLAAPQVVCIPLSLSPCVALYNVVLQRQFQRRTSSGASSDEKRSIQV